MVLFAFTKSRMSIAALSLLAVLGLTFAAAPVRDHDITPEDYFSQAFLFKVVVSPDGRQAAYTVGRWDEELDARNTDIWVADLQSGAAMRLTFDPAADESPVWSADSKWIYFKSKRGEDKGDPPLNKQTQIWRVPVSGGTEQAITSLKDGIAQFTLARDGRTLYYVTAAEHMDDAWKSLRKEFKKLEYGHGVLDYSEISALDLANWRTEKIVAPSRVIGSFAVSPDGGRIAMITTPNAELITNEGWSRVEIYDISAKSTTILPDDLWRAEAPSPYGWLEGLSWSADGKKLAFRVDFDGYPAELLIAHFESGGPVMQRLNRPGEFSLGGDADLQWLGSSYDLCFIAEEKARARVACIPSIQPQSQGALRLLTPGDVVVNSFDLSRDGATLTAILGTVTHPPDLYTSPARGKPALKRLVNSNPQVDRWRLPQIQIVSWTGANGDPCEGILELPPDYKPGQKLPLHVALHGGPTAADNLYFEFWIYGRGLWPSLGWAVFSPNYRGSTGYGDKFLTDLIGHENDLDVQDILAGVDMLIERGIADPEKMAVSGWSNGGYLTNCILTKTDRFKAASSGAGVLDMSLQWGIEDTPGHVINYMRGLPWEQIEEYRKASPLYDMHNIKTPTLIHVGGGDERVPAAHARALYRGLQYYLHVPTELVIYPGQGHGLRKYSHRLAKLKWDIAWFDYYVLGKPVRLPDNP